MASVTYQVKADIETEYSIVVIGEPGSGKTYFVFSTITGKRTCYLIDLEGRAHLMQQTEFPNVNVTIKNCRVMRSVTRTEIIARKPRTITERVEDPVASLEKVDEAIADLMNRFQNGERFDIVAIDGVNKIRDWGVEEYLADKPYKRLTEKNLDGWRYANDRLKRIAETAVSFQEVEGNIVVLTSRMKDKWEANKKVGTESALKREIGHMVHIVMQLEEHFVGEKDEDGNTTDYGQVEHWASFPKCSFGRIKEKFLDITYPMLRKIIKDRIASLQQQAETRGDTPDEEVEIHVSTEQEPTRPIAPVATKRSKKRSKKAARRAQGSNTPTVDED